MLAYVHEVLHLLALHAALQLALLGLCETVCMPSSVCCSSVRFARVTYVSMPLMLGYMMIFRICGCSEMVMALVIFDER